MGLERSSMQQPPNDFDEPPPHGGGFSPKLALVTFAFTTFVLGGFCFGWLFLSNWRLLGEFQAARVPVGPGPIVAVPAAPNIRPLPPRSAPVTATSTPAQAAEAADLPEWSGTSRINMLLLGIDHRDDEPIDGSRSDTIMVVSIDPVAKSAVMVSLPRDLWVSIPGHYNQRINVAHAVGGPTLIARTVEANFGLRINNFARIDFRGFEEIVDALGGVIVDVERTIKDDEYPTEDYGIQRILIGPGPQLMDGKLALQYARSRHSENDFGRARRQQRVLTAIRERGLQINILPKVPSLIGLVQKALQTDVGVMDMPALARLGSQIEGDRIKSVVVDATLADPFIGQNGEDLLLPRRADVQRAIQKAFAEASGQSARVEILNGSSRVGIARTLGDQLASAGYDVVRIDSADRTDYASSTLTVLSGNERAAAILAQRLRIPASAIQLSPAPDSQVDVRIILGNDYRP
jgi:polyisoprenyl-teichoic acid--peptidoglycan teichoic acid transferase